MSRPGRPIFDPALSDQIAAYNRPAETFQSALARQQEIDSELARTAPKHPEGSP
jgi:hypothetical protein